MFLQLCKDRSGVSAVEFALVAPIMGAVVALGWSVWQGESGIEHAKTALRAAAEYYTAGGNSDPTAQTIALNAWSQAPSNATVTINRACFCAGAGIDCSLGCIDGQQKTVYVTLAATGTGKGVFASRNLTQQEVVRVQ